MMKSVDNANKQITFLKKFLYLQGCTATLTRSACLYRGSLKRKLYPNMYKSNLGPSLKLITRQIWQDNISHQDLGNPLTASQILQSWGRPKLTSKTLSLKKTWYSQSARKWSSNWRNSSSLTIETNSSLTTQSIQSRKLDRKQILRRDRHQRNGMLSKSTSKNCRRCKRSQSLKGLSRTTSQGSQ